MKVCVLGLSPVEMEHPRQRAVQDGLRQANIEFEVVSLPLWIGLLQAIEHPIQAAWIATKQFIQIVPEYRKIAACDFIFVPAFKQFLVPYFGLMARIARKPMLIDYMVGLVDVNEDRGLQKSRFHTRILTALDRWIIGRMNTVTDTAEHRAVFAAQLNVNVDKMRILPISIREALLTLPYPLETQKMVVQYFGEYIPFHGVDVIIEAAKLLQANPAIQFELIGRGQQYEQIEGQVKALALTNVRLIHDYFPLEQYMQFIRDGDVHLGVFRTSPKIDYVVPTKIIEGMGAGRPVITGQSAAIASNFAVGSEIIVVPTDDPQALAGAIQQLYDHPEHRQAIAHAGRLKVSQTYLARNLGERLSGMMREIIENGI